MRSTDSRKVNKRVLEALIKAGAFDFTKESRSRLLSLLNDDQKALFMKGLFNQKGEDVKEEDYSRYEKEVLSFYVSKHPLDPYEKLLGGKVSTLDMLDEVSDGLYTFAGVVVDLKVKKTQKGNYMAVFNFVDKTSMAEAYAFPEVYSEYAELIKEDQVIVGRFQVDFDEETEEVKLLLREAYSPEEFLKLEAKGVKLTFTKELTEEKLMLLKKTLEAYLDPEGSDLLIEVRTGPFRTLLQTDPRFKIRIGADLVEKLKEFSVYVNFSTGTH